MLNIVVPMAGRGQRFVDAGYSRPKPLIPVNDRPMIELVIANLRPRRAHRFHFLVQAEHLRRHDLGAMLRAWAPGCSVVPVDGVTEGAACTVLLARALVDEDAPLMIANCDQYVDVDIERYLDALADADGLIMTMWADDPKWSFVRRDGSGRVAEVVEKRVVSNEATVGVYNFRSGADFLRAADAMIAADERVNGEFYVAPVYNRLIAAGADIRCYDVGSAGDGMYGIGTPADLEAFCRDPASLRAIGALSQTGAA
ncbi:glycosyltransferase family 2 protein [Salinarimonas sp.]|uniref:glycosyltransferase family 2 protein n=1 Tax=Salinarimonas sp. TaxID=2766526 RepID=UPI0032D965DC